MTDDRQLEALLRDGLAAEARPVVADSGLTERIIATAAADGYHPAEPRLWQNWLMPAVAAALVALLVGSVLFGTKLLHSSSAPPASRLTPIPSLTHPVSPPPTAPHSTAPPASSTTPSRSSIGAPAVGGPVPSGFSGYDLTWVSQDEGWALGTAPCATAPCTSIVRTTDGGQHWIGLPAPTAFLSQTDTCSSDCAQVRSIRFVSAEVGYVFGPNSFWMTTDGGQHWQSEPGNAWGLEVAGTSVLRVSGGQPNCAPGCQFQVQRAAIGSTDWHDVALPGPTQDAGASLSASGNTALLTTTGNPAGGAGSAQSIVFSSTDSGASWSKVGEPCPQGSVENDSLAVSVAQDASAAALCQPRPSQGSSFLVLAAGAGQPFAQKVVVPGAAPGLVTALDRSTVFIGGDRLYRWDGSSITAVSGPSKPRFIGFESATVGRVLADNGLWTTSDGGRTWSPLTY